MNDKISTGDLISLGGNSLYEMLSPGRGNIAYIHDLYFSGEGKFDEDALLTIWKSVAPEDYDKSFVTPSTLRWVRPLARSIFDHTENAKLWRSILWANIMTLEVPDVRKVINKFLSRDTRADSDVVKIIKAFLTMQTRPDSSAEACKNRTLGFKETLGKILNDMIYAASFIKNYNSCPSKKSAKEELTQCYWYNSCDWDAMPECPHASIEDILPSIDVWKELFDDQGIPRVDLFETIMTMRHVSNGEILNAYIQSLNNGEVPIIYCRCVKDYPEVIESFGESFGEHIWKNGPYVKTPDLSNIKLS